MNKNIHHLFKTNPSLLDNVEVQELIEYCRELEGQYLKEKLKTNTIKNNTTNKPSKKYTKVVVRL